MKSKNSLKNNSKLWEDAKKYIPGGNMFLSKRPERFLPNYWPTFYKKSKSCYVTDVNNRKYTDMIMSIGTNILGYAEPNVNRAVIKSIQNGNMSTLNCVEEQLLAKKLIKMHSWSGGAKFARTGGEANAIAVRIARAFNKRTKIAMCGYHGWHDWYLSSNLTKSNSLKNHLLPGLSTDGVPKNLKNTVYAFNYNDLEGFKKIINKNKISMVFMEVSRNYVPENDFLKKIRKITKQKNIVLIFDECTSGFRQTYGGLHKLYKVNPDIAVFGKSLGNGYPITAIIGSKKIMEFSQLSFISSTFWSERSGYVAALKTLEIMEKKKSWLLITKKGMQIRNKWQQLSKKHNLDIEISGIPAISVFSFKSKKSKQYITFITQEMLKSGYLANNMVYVSVQHSEKVLRKYFNILDECFKKISLCESKKLDIKKLLNTTVFKENFLRLN
jgi:glutamate-1-semialdehyde 2,1-aminomutase